MGQTPSRLTILLLVLLPACTPAGRTERPAQEVARERAYAAGASALAEADFRTAVSHLAAVAATCPVDRDGRRAMLMLAAAELDPRNPERRPDVAAELAAFQLARPAESEPWIAPLAAELYVLALDYGADSVVTGAAPGALVLWSRYIEAGEPVPDGTPVTSEAPLGETADSASGAPGGAAGSGPRTALEAPVSGGPLCAVPDAEAVVMPRLTGARVVDRVAVPTSRPAATVTGSEDVRELMAENDRLRGELARKEQELDRIRRTLRP